jgi:dienelactone hydrolase
MLRLIAGVVLAAALVTGSRSGIGPVRQPAPTPVEYRPDAVLDEYRPAAPARGASAVLLVHGCCGDRRDLAAMARAIARRGVHVLNADVRAFHRGGRLAADLHRRRVRLRHRPPARGFDGFRYARRRGGLG